MKKVFLVLALVAAYGVSMAMSTVEVNTTTVEQVAFVDEVNNETPEKEGEKAAEAKPAKADAKATAKGEGCGTAKSEGCATAKSEGCGSKKTASVTKTEAKKEDSN